MTQRMLDKVALVMGAGSVKGASAGANHVSRNGCVKEDTFIGNGWDIAHAAVFLASDDAKFINGIVLPGRWRAACVDALRVTKRPRP